VRAIRFDRPGGPEVLTLVDVPTPEPGPGEVLVAVEHAGLNFIDTYHRSGLYPLPLPSGLGLEGVGTVVATGAGVVGRPVGVRVAWADRIGSYAEQVTVAADRTVLVPDALAPATACALMLQGMTAHYLATSTFPLGPGHTALVYAAAGGVGRLLVQLAAQRGARVLACTSSDAKAAAVRALGADETIPYRDVDVAARVRELTGGTGVDVVYDSVGAATWRASLASARIRGTVVFYGNASGPIPPVDLQELARHGSLFTTRPRLADHVVTATELATRADELFALAASGRLDVHVHGHYPLADAVRAQTDLESGTTSGKLLLDP
jgi:NADPH2:quinone reductase